MSRRNALLNALAVAIILPLTSINAHGQSSVAQLREGGPIPQWQFPELIVDHAQIGSPVDAQLLAMDFDLSLPGDEVLEIQRVWGWTWFIPLRLPSAQMSSVCRDIPLVVFETVAPTDIQIRDTNKDGRDELIVTLRSINGGRTTRVWSLSDFTNCRPYGRGGF